MKCTACNEITETGMNYDDLESANFRGNILMTDCEHCKSFTSVDPKQLMEETTQVVENVKRRKGFR